MDATSFKRALNGLYVVANRLSVPLFKIADRAEGNLCLFGKVVLAPIKPRAGGSALFGADHVA